MPSKRERKRGRLERAFEGFFSECFERERASERREMVRERASRETEREIVSREREVVSRERETGRFERELCPGGGGDQLLPSLQPPNPISPEETCPPRI